MTRSVRLLRGSATFFLMAVGWAVHPLAALAGLAAGLVARRRRPRGSPHRGVIGESEHMSAVHARRGLPAPRVAEEEIRRVLRMPVGDPAARREADLYYGRM